MSSMAKSKENKPTSKGALKEIEAGKKKGNVSVYDNDDDDDDDDDYEEYYDENSQPLKGSFRRCYNLKRGKNGGWCAKYLGNC